MPIDPITLGIMSALGGGLLSGFGGGGGPSLSDVMNEVSGIPQLKPGITKYPGGGFNAGGGSFNQGQESYVSLTGQQKRIDNALKGKGKNKNLQKNNPELYKYLVEGGDVSKIPVGLFGGKQKGLMGKGNRYTVPTQDVQANPQSEGLFNQAQMIQALNLQNQLLGQNFAMGAMPAYGNTYNSALGNANKYINEGLTELDPTISDKVSKASQAYFDKGKRNVFDAYNEARGGIFQNLSDSGTLFSSDLTDVMGKEDKNLALGLADLESNKQIFDRQLTDSALGNQRNALSTLYGMPSLGAGMQGFQVPNVDINPLLMQPYGVYGQGDSLFNMLNNQNSYALQREQMRLNPYLAALGPGFQLGNQPGLGGAIGGAMGGIAPYLFLSQMFKK